MTDEMEKQLAEMVRLERLKGPRNPNRAQQYFQPSPPQDMQAEYERLENLKRPRQLPPRPEPDFIAEREATKERLIAATGARLR
jgi:hypothetical protein